MAETKIDKSEKLLQELKKIGEELQFGSFVATCKIHAGELKEFEVSEVKRKFRVE